jgi:hypothetical protein
MSLAERLSVMEEYESLLRDRSTAGSQRRKMSFNPVEAWTPPHVLEEPVGAFEVPKTKRICMLWRVLAAFLHVLTYGLQYR